MKQNFIISTMYQLFTLIYKCLIVVSRFNDNRFSHAYVIATNVERLTSNLSWTHNGKYKIKLSFKATTTATTPATTTATTYATIATASATTTTK